MTPRTFCLNFNLAIGDVTVLTALARDLKATHPEHRVFVECAHGELWMHNPHARMASGVAQSYPDVEHVKVDYGWGIHGDGSAKKGPPGQKYRGIHFLRCLYEDFNRKTGLDVPTLLPRGDFHFAPEESSRVVDGRYWVVLPGGKDDLPAKVWDAARFQAVADRIGAMGLGVVQLGRTGTFARVSFHQPRLNGVVDLVGRTSVREMLRVIRDAEGVICGVTAAMHMAAALRKPCVVLAGGREAWWWEAYSHLNAAAFGPHASWDDAVPHQYLHTIGLLECVEHHGGCWKRYADRPGPVNCLRVESGDLGQPLPACLKMITSDMVMDALMEYYRDGTLPPITPRTTFVVPHGPEPTPRGPHAGIIAARQLGKTALRTAFAEDAAASATGGRFTLFTLLYGDYPEMHEKHLGGLLATTTPDRVEVRVLSNQLGAASYLMVDRLLADGRVASHDANAGNDRKYPVMRRAFRDPARPIETPYVIWCDDDTLFDADPGWLAKLMLAIEQEHPKGARLFGPHRIWTLNPDQAGWMAAGGWFRGRPFRDMAGREAPGASKVHFASGGFWALATGVIRDQDIPDPRLSHQGGDWTLGCQVQQGGWTLCDFSNNKNIVNWSAFARRGVTEPYPGTPRPA